MPIALIFNGCLLLMIMVYITALHVQLDSGIKEDKYERLIRAKYGAQRREDKNGVRLVTYFINKFQNDG